MSQAPPADPLFLAGTPSTQAGTPLRGVVARRAVAMYNTPRRNRTPLFAREYIHLSQIAGPLRLTTTFFSGFIQSGTLPIVACTECASNACTKGF